MYFQSSHPSDFAAELSFRKSFLHSMLQCSLGVGMPIPY